MMMKAGKPKICRVDKQAGDPGESLMLQLESKDHLLTEIPLPWGKSVFSS